MFGVPMFGVPIKPEPVYMPERANESIGEDEWYYYRDTGKVTNPYRLETYGNDVGRNDLYGWVASNRDEQSMYNKIVNDSKNYLRAVAEGRSGFDPGFNRIISSIYTQNPDAAEKIYGNDLKYADLQLADAGLLDPIEWFAAPAYDAGLRMVGSGMLGLAPNKLKSYAAAIFNKSKNRFFNSNIYNLYRRGRENLQQSRPIGPFVPVPGFVVPINKEPQR